MAEDSEHHANGQPSPRSRRWLASLSILAGVVNGLVLLFGPEVPAAWQFPRVALQVVISVALLSWGVRELRRGTGGGGRRSRQTVRLTLPAVGALVVMMVLFAGSLIGRSNPLMLVASMIAGPFVLNGWLAHAMLRRMDVRRRAPARVVAGESVWVDVEIANRKRWLAAWLAVLRDDVRSDEEHLQIDVPFLRTPAGTSATGRYQFVPMRRGRYRFGPLSLRTSFPFGFVERTLVVEDHAEMIVHPRVGRLTRAWRRDSTEERTLVPASSTRERAASDEFQRLREYRFGDSTRHIHWRTSARRGDLLVRDMRSETAAPLAIVLDPWLPDRPAEPDRERLELAVSLVATICVDELGRHREATIDVTVGGTEVVDWEGRSGPAGVEALLDELAILTGSPVQPLDRLLPALGRAHARSTSAIVVTTRSEAEFRRSTADLAPEDRRLFERARLVECAPEQLHSVFELDD